MTKPVELKCSGCQKTVLVPDRSRLVRDKLCKRCWDEWDALDRRANRLLAEERRHWSYRENGGGR